MEPKPRAGPSHATLALDHLRRIVQALRESSRESERSLGVTGAQLFVLQTLAKSSTLSPNALAEQTHTHQSTVSVVVKRLVARKLVQRRGAHQKSDADGPCGFVGIATFVTERLRAR